MKTVAVIGANFGDEGKGLITDFEVRRTNADMVVRFNGGAQAGHTVVDGDKRHVFGHLGSGTFAGASTYLSSDFIVNPLLLRQEVGKLDMLTQPNVLANEHARVSTIYDMAINGLIEEARGSSRHGSCGMGINETVTRHQYGPRLTLRDARDPSFDRVSFFRAVEYHWIPFRLKQLGLDLDKLPDSSLTELLKCRDAKKHSSRLYDAARSIYQVYDTDTLTFQGLVFEGAQGLALDEELGTFPHVTRSRTGVVGALQAMGEIMVRSAKVNMELTPVYVTRVYLTRHGAGPLEHENGVICDRELTDLTNKPNPWQGAFRYAPLNLPQLNHFIKADYERAVRAHQQSAMPFKLGRPNLAVTCLDQVGEKVRMIALNGVEVEIPTESAAEYIAHALGVNLSHSSRGPCAKDVAFHTIDS